MGKKAITLWKSADVINKFKALDLWEQKCFCMHSKQGDYCDYKYLYDKARILCEELNDKLVKKTEVKGENNG